MTLKIDDKAPSFNLLNDQNEPVSSTKLQGKKIILYFYPKDNTPGCTKEACDFRDYINEFKALGVEIFGISKDNVNRHQSFKKKYLLPFTLLTDPNADVCEAYEVMNKKSMFGKTFLGIQRSTFLIDEKGIIRQIWRKVKVQNHIKDILNYLKSNQTKTL